MICLKIFLNKCYLIFDGKNIFNETFDNNTNTQTISTTGLQAGIYIVQLQSGKNVLMKKLIIH